MPRLSIPVIELSRFTWERDNRSCFMDSRRECAEAAEAFEALGVVNVHDPQFPDGLDARCRRMFESYFALPTRTKALDERGEINHQVGWSPSYIESARDHDQIIETIDPNHRPLPLEGKDPKERFFIPIDDGHKPRETAFPGLNAPSVVPEGFEEWAELTEAWGAHMNAIITTYAQMLGVHYADDPNLFANKLRGGPHLLGPTGTDLTRFGTSNQCWARFHYDFNAITGHGKANAPGLYGWTRDLHRFPVRVPDGCFLLQAGKQMWWLTGGRIMYGFHEVGCRREILQTIRDLAERGVDWRVTLTLFAHVASDEWLEVLPPFQEGCDLSRFPRQRAGDMSMDEILALGL